MRGRNRQRHRGGWVPTNAAPAVFDPATLALTSWVRTAYAGAPWTGVASAGSSGSRNLATIGADPTAGANLNGRATASFDGAASALQHQAANNVLFSASAGAFAALFKANTAPTASASDYANGNLLGDPMNAETIFGYTSHGCGLCMYTGGFVTLDNRDSANLSASTGAWHLYQVHWNGTTVRARVDSNPWVSKALGALSFLTPSNPCVGKGYPPVGIFFDGLIAETLTAAVNLSDSDFDNIKSYVNSRHGLSL